MKRRIISLAVMAACACFASPVLAHVDISKNKSAVAQEVTTQLPRNVKPSHYEIALIPEAKEARFKGHAKITIDLLKNSSEITLNANELSFNEVSLLDAKSKQLLEHLKVIVDAKAQTATVQLGRELGKGQYQLVLEYEGKIGTQAVGLFSLDYESAQGKKRALYTQFENSDARRVMPSWDEPIYKATYDLSVSVPNDEMAVSNMPIVSKTDQGNGRSWVKFGRSPKMSSYLLFLGMGDFERATEMADGVEIGVITKRGSLDQARYVLGESKNILREFNDYFGVPYPLPKLDNVAAPGQSQFFSAMENWGAIFTFEGAILLDPSISMQGHKEGAFVTAAHETAHQWFGDLVTMKWWDDLWLNEGFASWMENRTKMRLHPEWHPEFDAIGVRESAISRDAIATTHPVVQHIETVEQASQAFDTITYQKGEAVIRMLENYVGADAWRNGVRAYMKKHAYGNTVTADFFQEVEKAAHKPITAIAKDFTQQAGVPLVRVEDIVCKDGKTTISLTQGEFSKDQPNKTALNWRVPVVAQIAGSHIEGRTLLVDGKGSLKLAGCGTVVVNAGQNGYYRTLYTPKTFGQIANNFSSLAAIDQVGVLADSWSMGLAGQQEISNILDLANAIPADAAPQVWSDVAGTLSTIHQYYRKDPTRQKAVADFAIKRLSPLMQKMGWIAKPGEPEFLASFRTELIGVMSSLGDPATLAEATRRFEAMDTDPSAAPASLRLLILSIVARNADQATWDKLHARALAEKSSMLRGSLYHMLAISKDKALAQKALDLALTDEPGVTNSAGMIGSVAGSFPDMAFDFAIAHMKEVNDRVDATSRSRFFPRLGTGSLEPEMIDKLNSYAEKYLDVGSRREVETAIVAIKYRMKIRQERVPAITAWLDKHM